ncbi:unnamed protein product [Acanthoscelides obtectus]|uniref:Uncharacterized protein n=1 Tax=Acanthoscelides obtectus TaxID=200917 RepID=A0A9P0M989_ACAOB|nr:unnamed protein product [Acanthoscelides obtectus]CAK1668557.1 Protein ZBED8 [Acanthoscelides obtectus]
MKFAVPMVWCELTNPIGDSDFCLCVKIGEDDAEREKEEAVKRPTLDRMFASTSQRKDDGLRASYNISLLIAKSGKPHTIGEKLILPAVEEVLKTVLHKPASDIMKRIPLSNNTVERRIDEMKLKASYIGPYQVPAPSTLLPLLYLSLALPIPAVFHFFKLHH